MANWRRFYTSYVYPEQDDVAADLKVMNDKHRQLHCCSGEAIHDLVWLRDVRTCRRDSGGHVGPQ